MNEIKATWPMRVPYKGFEYSVLPCCENPDLVITNCPRNNCDVVACNNCMLERSGSTPYAAVNVWNEYQKEKSGAKALGVAGPAIVIDGAEEPQSVKTASNHKMVTIKREGSEYEFIACCENPNLLIGETPDFNGYVARCGNCGCIKSADDDFDLVKKWNDHQETLGAIRAGVVECKNEHEGSAECGSACAPERDIMQMQIADLWSSVAGGLAVKTLDTKLAKETADALCRDFCSRFGGKFD